MRGFSSVGRALPLQGRCQEFESPKLHRFCLSETAVTLKMIRKLGRTHILALGVWNLLILVGKNVGMISI